MKLITEQIDDIEILTEEKNGKKNLYIEGTFLQGNIKNRNGRMYPMETLAREVDKYSNTYIKSGRAMGELGHPDGPIVNLDRVSHLITSLVQEGSNFKGKAKILETPMGQIAKSLLSEGVRLGVSSRGVGSLKLNREGVNVVADDFMLATAADIVADPSAPEAFVNGIMEGKEWVWTNSALKESDLRKVERDLDNASSKQELAERQITAFETFLKGL
tara:strand:- start:1718 stop:2368 length:651 start_codon:yes stop_codon:yes gene_type:complete